MWLQLELTKIVAILEPIARSIKCFKLLHTTPADVMVFWMAALASYEKILSSSVLKLPRSIVEDIRAILNKQFNEMTKDAPSDCYAATFLLEPRYRDALANDKPNPFAHSFIIRTRHASGGSDIPIKRSTLQHVGSYLVEVLLQNEYALKDLRHPILHSMPAGLASGALNQQIIAYVRRDYPFNQDPALGESTCDWWSNLVHHSGASILALLAVKLFSICSNSMADEHTMSVVTHLSPPITTRCSDAGGSDTDHDLYTEWARCAFHPDDAMQNKL
ncbi:hypothetical protein FRB95_011059 [Tulasnella sp. JGI-2019a]|nr:hypothetical protein FRB95_011059 [Tulasnella sp. JGI-2019a]